jgi:hypothetical protein
MRETLPGTKETKAHYLPFVILEIMQKRAKTAGQRNSTLLLTRKIVFVPVVQRIERRFPKTKTAFLQAFADILSSAQMPLSKTVQ